MSEKRDDEPSVGCYVKDGFVKHLQGAAASAPSNEVEPPSCETCEGAGSIYNEECRYRAEYLVDPRLSMVDTCDVLHDLEVAERLTATQEVRPLRYELFTSQPQFRCRSFDKHSIKMPASQQATLGTSLAPQLIRRGPVLSAIWTKRFSCRLNAELARLKNAANGTEEPPTERFSQVLGSGR